MINKSVFILGLCVCVSGQLIARCWAQDYQQTPPFISEKMGQQRENLRDIEELLPTLAKLEMRLKDLQGEIDKIMRAYRQGELDKPEAVAKVRVLAGEQLDIRNSKEYQREHTVLQLFGQVDRNEKKEIWPEEKRRRDAELEKEKSRIFDKDLDTMMRSGGTR